MRHVTKRCKILRGVCNHLPDGMVIASYKWSAVCTLQSNYKQTIPVHRMTLMLVAYFVRETTNVVGTSAMDAQSARGC